MAAQMWLEALPGTRKGTTAMEVLLMRMLDCDKIASSLLGRLYYAPHNFLASAVSELA